MSSTDPEHSLSHEQRSTLLRVARDSIDHGLTHGAPLAVNANDYEEALTATRACFVTLNLRGDLRGCIGHLEAIQPLVVDVAENAFAAAFRDPRFPPLTGGEWPEVSVHISVLSPAQPMHFRDEQDLLAQLRPGKDGLIVRDGPYRGTFLPSVWESLPQPTDFFMHLKGKAGLPADYWSDSLQVSRYTTESFGDA